MVEEIQQSIISKSASKEVILIGEGKPEGTTQANQEVFDTDPFEVNLAKTLRLHEDEIPRFVKSPEVALVKRSYKELSNGNLTDQLDTIGDLAVSSSAVEAIFVVNNPRIIAVLSELVTNLPQDDHQSIANRLKLYYQSKGWALSDWEREFTDSLGNGSKNVDRLTSAFQENQVTLGILRQLTDCTVQVDQGINTLPEALKQLEDTLPLLTEKVLSSDQTKLLVQAAQKILKKGILVIGLDCSSKEKGFSKTDLGQATLQGSCVAIARNATYIDISDMDQFHPRHGLDEIVNLADKKDKPDVLYRPLHTITPKHPEQLKNADWTNLVNYYSKSVIKSTESWKYVYYQPESDFEAVHNTGHIVVSGNTFKKHQYPNGDYFEDLGFSRGLQTDLFLVHHQLLDTELLLSQRGREESYDGRHYSTKPFTQIREQIEQRSADSITEWITLDQKIEKALLVLTTKNPELAELVNLYQQQKDHFLKLENNNRRELRFIFFGENGLITKLFPVVSVSKDITEIDLKELGLTEKQATFIKDNPALIPALQKEVTEGNINSPESLTQMVEQSIPEFFHPNITANDIRVNNIDSHDLLDFLKNNKLANVSLWIHLYKGRQWLAGYITNRLSEGSVLPEARDSLAQVLQYCTS